MLVDCAAVRKEKRLVLTNSLCSCGDREVMSVDSLCSCGDREEAGVN